MSLTFRKSHLLSVAKLGGACLDHLLIPASLKFRIQNDTWKAENEVPVA